MESSQWKKTLHRKMPSFKMPMLIVGLPGIGNVGKISVDFLIEELKAKKIVSFTSSALPHCVFVGEDNLVELPTISLYHFVGKKRDLLFLGGDIQPIDERACYEFCDLLLEMLKTNEGFEVVTLGGIGLHGVPKQPKVYCTGSSEEFIKSMIKGTKMERQLYGVVGPIIGVSGVLLGLAKIYNVPAVGLLAETFGHPVYLGVAGAKELLKVLKSKLDLKINLEELEKEIKEIESEVIKRSQELEKVSKQTAYQKLADRVEDTDYIG